MKNTVLFYLLLLSFEGFGQLKLSKYLVDNYFLHSHSSFNVKNGKPKEIIYYRNKKKTAEQSINKEQLVYRDIIFENKSSFETNFKYDEQNNLIKVQRKEFFNLDTAFHELFYARSVDSFFYLSVIKDSCRTILRKVAFEKIDVEKNTRNILSVECQATFDSILLKKISNKKEIEKSIYDSIFHSHTYTNITYNQDLKPIKIKNNSYYQNNNFSSFSEETLNYQNNNSGSARVVYGFGNWYEYNFTIECETNLPIGTDDIPKKAHKLIFTIDKKGNWTRRIYYSEYEQKWIIQRRKIKYW